MTSISIKIVALRQEHLDDVLAISDIQFGKGYISRESLQNHLIDPECMALCCMHDDKVIGFSTMKVVSFTEFISFIKHQPEALLQNIKNYKSIGYRMQTALLPEFTEVGIGYQLVEAGNRLLLEKCKIIVSIVWKKPTGFHMPGILKSQGFKKLVSIDNFWTEDSIKYQYDCAICGKPPCHCSACIYFKAPETI